MEDREKALPEGEELVALPKNMYVRTFFLGGIFFILLFSALKISSQFVIPIVVAFVLKLVLQPALRFLERLGLPRLLSVILILLTVFTVLVMLGTALSGPAVSWAGKLPTGIPRLQERLGFLNKPIEAAQRFMSHAEALTQGSGPRVMPVEIEGNRLTDRVVDGLRQIASTLFTTVLVLFFLMLSGDTFLRKLVEVLPRFQDKRQAVDISQHIEKDLSAYLLTITLMNLIVGVGTGAVMYSFHIGDTMLWAVVAFLLNYIPIIGPMIGFVIFLGAGLLSVDNLALALMPGALYLLVHVMESMLLTPLLLAKRFTLNPVLVIVSLVFWYWLWGLSGAILAMPMLAIFKIICDRIETLNAVGHFLEG